MTDTDTTAMVSVSGRSIMTWAGVSAKVLGSATAAEAIKAGGLDWKVRLVDAGYRVNGGVFKASNTGKKVVARLDEEGKPSADLGYVGRRYHVIQNSEVFDWCDRLVDDTGAKYETVFSMWDGSMVGLTMRFPDEVMIGGEDAHAKHLIVTTRHDGTGSMVAAVSMTRLACMNQLNVALRSASDRVRIPHLSNASQKIAAARDSLKLTFRYVDAFEREMEALIQRTIDEDTADAIIKEVLGKHRFGGLEAKSATIRTLAKESPTIQDQLRRTRYGILQAATEWLDWGRRAKSPHGNAQSTLEGTVRKAKGDLVAALAN